MDPAKGGLPSDQMALFDEAAPETTARGSPNEERALSLRAAAPARNGHSF